MKIAVAVLAGALMLAPQQAKLNFTFKDATGKKVALSSFKGKVIILDFWATWCVPCKAEIPDFIALQAKYGAQGLQVVGLSVDDTQSKAQQYMTEMKMNYPVLLAEGKEDILEAYDPIPSIPVSIIIDRQGRIVGRHLGIATKNVFENEIKPLL